MNQRESNPGGNGHNRRVGSILRRARNEVALRDVVVFSVARVWVVVLALAAVIYALVGNLGIHRRAGQDEIDHATPSE